MLLALVFVAQMILATDIEPSVTLTDYYSGVNNKSGEAIRTALYNKIHAHTTVTYDQLKYLFKWSDTYNNAGETIDDIYSFCDPAYTETWCLGTCGYNREHSVPKSWFNEADVLYSDAFHLYPTNCYVNSYRGNEAYGECSEGTKCTTNGVNAKGRKGLSTFEDNGVSYASVGTVYEPDDEFKGDLARTYFYMITCYMGNRFNYADGGIKMFTWQNDIADLSEYSVALLLKWHRQDPVSERELARNEVIYGNTTYNKCQYKQGNRNPFIDYPELAEYIWGKKKGQSVNLATLVSGYDSGSTPPEPPTPVIIIKHGVDWMVNGEIIQIDSIQENKTIQELPTNPSSCSTESATFVGCTDAPITGITDDAPAVLYTSAKDIPAITDDIALYAVFAKATTIESSNVPVEVDFDFNKLCTNSKVVTSLTSGDVTLTFAKGTNTGTAPTYYTKGTGIRCYGGNTMTVTANTITRIDFTFGTDENSNAILVNVGKFESPTWTGTADEVIFTIDGTSGNRRFATLKVTMNGNSSVTTYSRYQTTCSDPALHNIEQSESKAVYRKLLLNGQLYILANDQLYTITGQKVQK